jgi:hypothetical protein
VGSVKVYFFIFFKKKKTKRFLDLFNLKRFEIEKGKKRSVGQQPFYFRGFIFKNPQNKNLVGDALTFYYI